MARWAPAKRDAMRALATEVTQHHPLGRLVVAVTGAPGPGVLDLADDLAEELRHEGRRVFRADAVAFERDSGANAPRASARSRSLDETALRRALVDPFRLGGSTGFQTAVYDPSRGVPVVSEWSTAGADATLIVAGRGLLRRSLAGLWDASVWVDVPRFTPSDRSAEFEAAGEHRAAGERDAAGEHRAAGERDVGDGTAATGDLDGVDAVIGDDSRAAASVLIDLRDPEHPRRVYSDSC